MRRKIFIVDDSCSIVEAGSYLNKNMGEKDMVVSFSLSAGAMLRKSNINVKYPDQLVDLSGINMIGEDNLERTDGVCGYLGKKLQEKVPYLKTNDIDLISAAYFPIKVFFDQLYTSCYMLEKIMQNNNLDKIVIFKPEYELDELVEVRGAANVFFNAMIPALAENVFKRTNYNIEMINTGRNTAGDKKTLVQRYNLKKIWGRLIAYLSSKIRRASPGKYNGIILKSTHDLLSLNNEIIKNVNIYNINMDERCISLHSNDHLDIRLLPKQSQEGDGSAAIEETFEEALKDADYRKLFKGNDELMRFSNLCLKSFLLKNMKQLLSSGNIIKGWMASLRPRFLVTPDCRHNLNKAFIFESIRSSGVPIVTYQEGGGAGYLNWPLFNLDMRMSDHYLVYGNGVKNSPFIRGRANVVPVGSLRLARIKNKLKNRQGGQSTVCVVMDNLKTNTYQHYPFNGGLFSQAYANQLHILNALKAFEEIKFIIKTVSGKRILYEKFSSKNIIIEEKPLVDMLDQADAFILDYPSTTLLECLMTNKPIALLYNPEGVEFETGAEQLLKKRIRMSSSPGEYGSMVRAIISDIKHGSKMTKEREFVDNYCLMENTENRLREFFGDLVLRGNPNE